LELGRAIDAFREVVGDRNATEAELDTALQAATRTVMDAADDLMYGELKRLIKNFGIAGGAEGADAPAGLPVQLDAPARRLRRILWEIHRPAFRESPELAARVRDLLAQVDRLLQSAPAPVHRRAAEPCAHTQ
jgi:hypothetical protein